MYQREFLKNWNNLNGVTDVELHPLWSNIANNLKDPVFESNLKNKGINFLLEIDY